MIKEALEYLVSLKDNKTYEIGGEIYSDAELWRVPEHVDRPDPITVNGLDSIVKLVKNELDMMENRPIFIRVEGPRRVDVFSTLDSVLGRDDLYHAVCDAPEFKPGWRDHQVAIIELQSMFAPSEDLSYLLDLLGRVSVEDAAVSEDNGVSQVATVTHGVSLKRREAVKPRVTLAPYRTFTEVVEQPASEFLLRLDEEGRVGLLEADGGKWRLTAKRSIKAYFDWELKPEIEAGHVVVMV